MGAYYTLRQKSNLPQIAIRFDMTKLFRDKKGLSTVVTTLIILVVSVLLAASVTYFATNISANRVQDESLTVRQAHLWVNATGSEGALWLVNTGGRDIVIDKIAVRGQAVPWANVYLWRASDGGVTIINTDLNVTKTVMGTTATSLSITVNSAARTFSQQSGKFSIRAAEGVVIYVNSPGSLTIGDIGLSMEMTPFSARTSYAKEVNVKTAT